MIKSIMTVCGEIKPEDIGYTQSHEHIFIEKDKSYEISNVLWMDEKEKSEQELNSFYNAGGRTIVDAQPVMAGRMAELLKIAAKNTNVNIIASTGFHKTIFYYDESYIFHLNTDEIADLYIKELSCELLSSRKSGYEAIDSKAGIIKVATDSGGIKQDKTYEKLFTASAHAAYNTNAPIMCHMETGAEAFEVIDFYKNNNINTQQLILAHLDRTKYDLNYHKEILSTGVFLEYDTIAREKYHDNAKEIKLIYSMIEQGFEDQILLGLDTTRQRLRSYGGKIGLDYLLTEFVPMLLNSGIDQLYIDKMLKKNPAQALSVNRKDKK